MIGSGPVDCRDVTDRPKEAVTQLEASHPQVTLLMRQVIDQLGYSGLSSGLT